MTPLDRVEPLDQAPDDLRRRAAIAPEAPAVNEVAAVAEKAAKGSVILAMLPDTGERYLSTFLFEGVPDGSDDEWLATQG